MIEIIDERSVRTDLLTPGGHVLDVGARGYVFARKMAARGCCVVALDPEPTDEDETRPAALAAPMASVSTLDLE